jgi:hypothetical protein
VAILYNSPAELNQGVALGPQPFFDQPGSPFRVYIIPTGENIYGSILVFRPGMNGNMRFSDIDHSAHSVRGEVIKGLAHYGSATLNGSFVKTILEKIYVIEHLLIADFQF